tara:strand:- start:6475 stop:7692 length:1218 start_codon:yes stop_codon:yes gene_type:complete
MFYSEFKNFNKYFKNYLLFILFFCSIQLFWKHEGGTDSTISEWLINYQGGFVRRGFLGEFFFQIAIYFQIKIRLVILIFQILIYSSYLYLLCKYINQIKKNFLIILSIFSPLLIVYHLAEVETLARKEVLIFIHFLILLIFFEHKKNQTIYLSLSFPILLLIWEPIIFFSGFYLIIILMGLSIRSFLDIFNRIVLPAIPSIIVFNIILFNNYSIADQDIMCSNLQKFVGERCYMSLGYVTSSIFDNYMSLLKDIKISHLIRYSVALLVGFFPLILILLNLKKTNRIKNNFISKIKITKLFLLASFPVLNLFLMGLDWGRWCNIFYFYSLTTIFYLIIKKYYFLDLNYINKYLSKNFTKKKIKNFSIVLFVIFSFTWNLKATFKEDIGSLPIYRMPAKTIKNILSF